MGKDVEIHYQFEQTPRQRRTVVAGSPVRQLPLPRITRLMALAISIEAKLGNGSEVDAAALARCGSVSRSRITQIVNLLHLAPDIQEQLLTLPPHTRGREAITESSIRPLTAEYNWQRQRERFERMLAHRAQGSDAQ